MANNYCQFSASLDLGTPENAAKALAIFAAHQDKANGSPPTMEDDGYWCFDVQDYNAPHNGLPSNMLWINSGDESGVPEHVVEFVAEVGKALKLKGKWGFTWACTCDKLRLDEFDGGAVVINFDRHGYCSWVNATNWLQKKLRA